MVFFTLTFYDKCYAKFSLPFESSSESGLKERATEYGIAEPRKLLEVFQRWRSIKSSLQKLENFCLQETDTSMMELYMQKFTAEKVELMERESELRRLLLSAHQADDHENSVVEIRAGTGGVEASLFAEEVLSMYERYCLTKGWSFEVSYRADVERSVTTGLREAVVEVTGEGAFGRLKWESGVHRVQRVPQTDAQGRVHTSTVTIAVLPRAQIIHVELNEADLQSESFKSSGPGGQHVNKTNSAVRITHLPTGIAVAVQEERCAQQNRMRALDILKRRLYENREKSSEYAA